MNGATVARLLAWALAVDMVALAASGTGLTANYRPEPVMTRSGGFLLVEASRRGGGVLADIHRVTAVVGLVLLAGVVVTVALQAVRPRNVDVIALAALLIAVGAGALSFVSGDRLPWSQLAIWAQKAPPGGLRGVWRAAFDPLIRFVIVGGREVDQPAYRSRVVLHVLAAPGLLVIALCLARLRAGAVGQGRPPASVDARRARRG